VGVMAKRAIIALGMLLAWGRGAYALDPALDVSQYAHTAWKVRDGFSRGSIDAIAQTPDGYLWLGTELGLLRFDGLRAVPWQPRAGEKLPSDDIRSLLVARDGTLWIGTLKGLASWKDGKLGQYPEIAGQVVDALLEDREGTLWAGGQGLPTGRLCAIRSGSVQCHGEDGSLGRAVESLYEDSRGNLWAGAETGLWRWKPGPPKFYPLPATLTSQTLIGGDNGALLIAVGGGIRQFVDGKVERYPLPVIGPLFTPRKLLRDRNDGLWIGSTNGGLLHVHQGRTDVFAQADGLSGDNVQRLFEDREGNIWVATLNGLDRFRDFAVATISVNQGLPSGDVWSVLAAKDGGVWLGGRSGLSRLKDGHITIYGRRTAPRRSGRRDQGELSISGSATEIANSGLEGTPMSLGLDDQSRLWASTHAGLFYFESGRFVRAPGVPGGNTFSIGGDGQGNVWVLNGEAGVFYRTPEGRVQQIPGPRLGENSLAQAMLPDRSHGGVWLGFLDGEIAYFKDGDVRASYTAADGLGKGRVDDLRFGSHGTLWAATEGGLSRIRDSHIITLTGKNGLPCDTVHWSIEDDDHFVWIFTTCGLVRIAESELDAWVNDPKRIIETRVFDASNGVRSLAVYGGYGPHVTKSPDGKIWFVTYDGVSVIDPRHLPFNRLTPPVHIEQINADHETYWQNLSGDASSSRSSSSQPCLPPLVRDLTIEYTALSLVVPEKVHFRYKLEGWDREWQDAGTRRQAFYTNLAPRKYRFRVMACNNSGVWNEAGDTLDFSIAPAYYQTRWFQLACVAAFMVLLWALYQLRLRQLARQFNMRLEERVGERTRIARDLHDTLLQSFQGLVFRFQGALNQLPNRPEKAYEVLESALISADQAIAEGRSAIQELRSGSSQESNLEQTLLATGRELASSQNGGDSAPTLRVIVEGTRRAKRAMIREEIYRIARELLRNAYRHAHARSIEAELRYDDAAFVLIVRDDGKGIDPKVLKERGRAGHWGLRGLYERAEGIGARLDVWSEAGAGTEVRLTVPGVIAYEKSGDGGRFKLFRKTRIYERRS
jgi:signal transduction histidine kinase/ligand-binding sensor domain-containing protein